MSESTGTLPPDLARLQRNCDLPTAIADAVILAMRGQYTIAVQWIADDGELRQNVYRNIAANRLQESSDVFRKAQLDEAMRVEIREQVKAVLKDMGIGQ